MNQQINNPYYQLSLIEKHLNKKVIITRNNVKMTLDEAHNDGGLRITDEIIIIDNDYQSNMNDSNSEESESLSDSGSSPSSFFL